MSRRSEQLDALECATCARRYPAYERFCAVCATPLVHAGPADAEAVVDERQERARKIRPEYADGELVRVAAGWNEPEAEMIQALLLEAGVPSLVRRAGGFDVPDLLSAGPREVLAPRTGAERARELLLDAGLVQPSAGNPPPPIERRAVRLLAGVLLVGAAGAAIAWVVLSYTA